MRWSTAIPRARCPGCGATRGLHAHHIRHWEDGGPTELDNLVLLCPYHHRLHHRGVITITGPARRSHRHRQRRPSTERGIARAPTEPTPARGAAVPRTHRRARRLVVVPTIPAATTTNQQLGWLPGPVIRLAHSDRSLETRCELTSQRNAMSRSGHAQC